jgi:hypothetical protein
MATTACPPSAVPILMIACKEQIQELEVQHEQQQQKKPQEIMEESILSAGCMRYSQYLPDTLSSNLPW